jgi:hypothetical protein
MACHKKSKLFEQLFSFNICFSAPEPTLNQVVTTHFLAGTGTPAA